ncbi:tubulin-specific chaperone E [Paramormyrops kingsleyae]|uniref:Tubulin-specific chaperone E n=1 Tax=Paramormyrops kingsleyae TaxID=1676925 RepID=A0A3B3SA87_9TELE|nr:tubulin-specific chaperone E [Paramormyrops kingsleyae]
MRIINPEAPDMVESVPSDAERKRVTCDGERGTVRYVGAVPPTTGVWLGVEWDNPERGKHDGRHEGVQYFTCRHPTGGSFIRPQKASFGVTYLVAMRQRYEVDLDAITGEQLKISTRTVEMIGFEAVSEKQKVANVTAVSLRCCEVCGPGPENEIREMTPNVLSLDLSGNLLCCWEDVAGITRQLQRLQELRLGENRLSLPADPHSLAPAFASLKVLDLKGSAISWLEVLQCAPMWPFLEEMYVSDNCITELQKPVSVLHSLTVLDLSRNPIADGSEILKIADLPRLEKLNLAETGLSSLQFNDVCPGGKTAMFPALKILALDDNKISEWSVVNELEKLASLQQLSCHRNPLMGAERDFQTARQLLIASIGQLEALNKSQVTPEERKGAELDYCKMFGTKWLESGGHRDSEQNRPSAKFTEEHPRFQFLIQKYGAPEDGELKQQKPFALKNQLLNITFVCPDMADRTPVQKKLPDSMTVQKVKGLLHRMLKVTGSELRLTYTSSKMEGREIEIDNDLKPLQFYSVEDGDTVLVRWS